MEVRIDQVTGTAYVDRAGTARTLDLKTYAGQVAFALALQQLRDLAFIVGAEQKVLEPAAA